MALTKGFRDVSVTLGSRVAGLMAGIVTQSILAWSLGADARGSLAVCLSLAGLLMCVFSVGCDVAAVYFVSSRKFSISEGLVHSATLGVLCSVPAVAIGWILIQLPIPLFAQASPEAFHLSLLMVPLLLFSSIFHRLLTAVGLFGHYGAVVMIRSVSQLLFTVLFLNVFGWGLTGALYASLATLVIVVMASLGIICWKSELTRVLPSPAKLREMLSYGGRFYVGKVASQADLQGGTLLLGLFASAGEVGWFAVAMRLVTLVQMVPEAVTAALLPRVAGDEGGRPDLTARAARLVSVVSGGILLVLAVFAPLIVATLFSPEFLPAATMIRILALGAAAVCLGKVFASYLLGTRRPGTVSVAVASGLIANAGIFLCLLPGLGVYAAAWARTASSLLSSSLLFAAFRRFTGMTVLQVAAFAQSDWAFLGNRHTDPRTGQA